MQQRSAHPRPSVTGVALAVLVALVLLTGCAAAPTDRSRNARGTHPPVTAAPAARSATNGLPAAHATRTPTGHYEIQGRNRNSMLTLADGRTYDVRYWIPFDAPSFGFHDSPWQRFPYGSDQYRARGSHGCIHVPLRAITFLYGWVDIGTRVVIRR